MGSGSEAHEEKAAPLGRWLAGEDVHLLTGGGSGVMAAVTKAFAETKGRAGLAIGVLSAQSEKGSFAPPGYPNPWVEVPIYTHLHLSGTQGTDLRSRNHINILTADVVIALPGSHGTASEVELAVRYGKPVAAFISAASELPDLPEGVPELTELDQVKAFVRRALDR